MPSTYTGAAANITANAKSSASLPVDGDAVNAANVNAAYQKILDYCEYLNETLLAMQISTWIARTNPVSSVGLNAGAMDYTAVTGSKQRIVAVGANNGGNPLIILSKDGGNTWASQSNTLGANPLNGVACDQGQNWVTVGNAGLLATSADGVTWTARTSGFGATNVNGVGHNDSGAGAGSVWLAVGAADKVTLASGAGVPTSWTQSTISGTATNVWYGVAYGNGVWVAVGQNVGGDGIIYTSTNGTSWTSRLTASSKIFYAVVYSTELGLWVACGDAFYTSPNGTTWTLRSTPFASPGIPKGGVVWTGKQFVALSGSADSYPLLASVDGVTWRKRQGPTQVTGGTFLIAGQGNASLVIAGGFGTGGAGELYTGLTVPSPV